MPHIHRLFDFVVSAFLVHKDAVLLIHHKRYNEWLPLGGHIEMNEDPEQALFREIREESGLRVRILAAKPAIAHAGVKPLLTPAFLDVHRIEGAHRHIAFVYFAAAASRKVRLHTREHHAFRWLTAADLTKREYRLSKSIRFYCRRALEAARTEKRRST